MIKNFLSILIALIVSLCSLTGCKGFLPPSETTEPTETQNAQFGHSEAVSDLVEIFTYPSQEVTKTEVLTEYDFELSEIPDFSGSPYVVINGNLPYFDESDYSLKSFESYSDLDALNRCGTTFACIGRDIMPTEERGEIGHIKPSGWHTVKYNGVVDGNYLYNRCHLIAFCLAGENDNKLNLVTGTRSFNVDSMYYYEEMVLNYMKENPNNRVLYRVTPIYVGDELVCRGVQMEGLSIEDDTICFNVFCYNVQDGVIIDYATGESRLENETVEEPTNTETSYVGDGTIYIINTNTMKIHTEDCRYADSDNTEIFNGLIDYLLDNGYVKCKVCEP